MTRHPSFAGLLLAASLWLAGCAATTPQPEAGAATASLAVEPEHAPPGTVVTLRATGLPPNARFGIGAGPPASEYEIFAHARSDAEGRLTTTIAVPGWAASGSRLIFALSRPGRSFDVLSGPFVVD